MRSIAPIAEAEVIAVFLKTEIESPRFAPGILEQLVRDGQTRELVDHPDLQSETQNQYRRRLLGELRGLGRNISLFENFPENVRWERALITSEELGQVRYINYSYWNELSGGPRLAADAALRLRCRLTEVYGQSTAVFWEMSNALRQEARFPELILVGTDEHSPLVVLEGHVRLTAYLLRPEVIPNPLPVVVGYSSRMGRWME